MRRWGATTLILSTLAGSGQANDIVPLGPEFLATSRTSFDQHDIWIGCDDSGRFVLSYAQGEIYIRRFDRDGNPLGADEQLNTSLTAGTQDETYVTMDPASGDFLVCYSDRHGNDGDGMGAAGRFMRADGTAYGIEQILNTQTSGSQFEPHAAFAPSGRVFVVWTDAFVDGSAGVIGRLFERDGTAVTSEFLVNTPSSSTQIDPSVAASRDGRFVVAYVDASGATGDPREVLCRLYDADGTALGAPLLVNGASAGMQRDPIVAMDGDGDFVVVWQDESGTDGDGWGVFARLFDKDGAPKGSQFIVSQVTAGDQVDPHVTMDYMGNFVVTWESDASGDFDVYLRRFDRSGLALSGDVLAHVATAGDQTHGKSCLTQSGERLVTVWHDSGGGGDAYARVFTMKTIEVDGLASLNNTVTLDLDLPGMGGALYFVLPSLGTAPGIAVNGYRTLHLEVDDLLLYAFSAPNTGYFQNILGNLDANGRGQASFTVPNLPSFYSVPVYFAVLTILPGQAINWNLQSGSIDKVGFLSDTYTVDVSGPGRFHPGQTLLGEIDSAGEEDRASFEGLKAEKIKIKVEDVGLPLAGSALGEVVIEILDSDDVVISSSQIAAPGATGKVKKAKFKVPADGSYAVRVSGAGGATGHYKLTTSHKLKKSALPGKKTRTAGKDGFAKLTFRAKTDSLLDLVVKPKGGAALPVTVELDLPSGQTIDLLASLAVADGTLVLVDHVLTETGKYAVRIPGPQGTKYKVVYSPTIEFADPDLEIE